MDEHLAHVFNSIGELKSQSSMAIVGTVSGQTSQTMANSPVTLSTVRVDQVLWSKGGNPVAPSLVVWQLGGKASSGARFVMDDYPVFTPGARYVLFLTPASNAPGDYWVTGAFQGAFAVDTNGVVRSYSAASVHVGVYFKGLSLATFAKQVQAA